MGRRFKKQNHLVKTIKLNYFTKNLRNFKIFRCPFQKPKASINKI